MELDLDWDTDRLKVARSELMLHKRTIAQEKQSLVEEMRNHRAGFGGFGRQRSGLIGAFNKGKARGNNSQIQDLDRKRDSVQSAINAIDVELIERRSSTTQKED